MEEIWKDVVGYEGLYQISAFGEIRSLNGKILSQHISNTGYYRVKLHKCGERKFFSVHRLVAITFIPNPGNKPQVNHIDGNRLNNFVNNLEWATTSENVLHAYKSGLNYGLRGELSPHKIAVLQYEKDGTFVKKWPCMVDAARFLNGTKEGIYAACRQKNCKTYKGFVWRYAEG